eukprot:2187576-Prymnesium_polylepis.1
MRRAVARTGAVGSRIGARHGKVAAPAFCRDEPNALAPHAHRRPRRAAGKISAAAPTHPERPSVVAAKLPAGARLVAGRRLVRLERQRHGARGGVLVVREDEGGVAR